MDKSIKRRNAVVAAAGAGAALGYLERRGDGPQIEITTKTAQQLSLQLFDHTENNIFFQFF